MDVIQTTLLPISRRHQQYLLVLCLLLLLLFFSFPSFSHFFLLSMTSFRDCLRSTLQTLDLPCCRRRRDAMRSPRKPLHTLPRSLDHSLPSILAGKQVGGSAGASVCFRPDGVAIFGLVTAFILIATTTVSVSSFLKMRRIRRIYEMHSEGAGSSSSSSLYKNALSHENRCYTNHFNRRRF